MKTAQYGTAIVVMHVIAHGLHGLAHQEIPVSFLCFRFVCGCCGDIGSIAAGLLWTPFSTASVAGFNRRLFCNLQSSLGH